MQQNGLQTYVTIDRATAARYGFAPNQVDAVLYDAFGQRTVSTIYNPYNQYFVVMEVAPKYWQHPQDLNRIFLSTAAGNVTGTQQTQMPAGTVIGVKPFAAAAPRTASSSANALNANAQANLTTNAISNSRGGTSSGSADSTAAETMVPLAALARSVNNHTAIQVNHQSGLIAATLSFNLPPGGSLSSAQAAIDAAMRELGAPASIHGGFQGSAQVFAQSLATIPLLILAALVAVYIVLGILYENTIHPLTILSTLPSAGIGATLALLLFGVPFSMIALIGIILLIGIVKKNAIMMIDVAIHLERNQKRDGQGGHSRGRRGASAADHDDHGRRGAGRRAARHRHRPGGVAAPAARHHRHGRAHPQPDLHALHDAGDLSFSQSPAPQAGRSRFRIAVATNTRTGFERLKIGTAAAATTRANGKAPTCFRSLSIFLP